MLDPKSRIVELVKNYSGIDEASITLEIPPDPKLGDFAFPCFAVSKKKGGNPVQIAKELAEKISREIKVSRAGSKDEVISEVKQNGPYLNFFTDISAFAKFVLSKIVSEGELYGSSGAEQRQRIMIEYLAPNTNKPLHLGHVRNIAIGSSLSKIHRFLGNTVIEANLINDRGVHICKSMLAYKKWGHGITPERAGKKPDHLVGDFYVLYAEKSKERSEFEAEVHEMLRKWEQGDPEVVSLWRLMNQWVYEGFQQTLDIMKIRFDKVYYESELYKLGRDIVEEGLKKGLFKKDQSNAVIAELSKDDSKNSNSLPDKVLIRSDGTSIYITQDIYLAVQKFKEFDLDKSLYVVGSEQILHFKQLFKILDILGYAWARHCVHVSYGLVNLPEGRMKSREGKIVDADDIIAEMLSIAKLEILKRHPGLDEEEVDARAKIIGLGALKFYMLVFDPVREMVYNPEESISFEGETGPYVQYGHARCCSILEKYSEKTGKIYHPNIFAARFDKLGHKKEAALIKMLNQFPDAVKDSADHYRPSSIAKYLVETTQRFNEFYQECIVLSDDKELSDARLLLVDATKTVLKKGLELLGITAPERM